MMNLIFSALFICAFATYCLEINDSFDRPTSRVLKCHIFTLISYLILKYGCISLSIFGAFLSTRHNLVLVIDSFLYSWSENQ